MSLNEAIQAPPALRPPFFRCGPGHALLALIGWFTAIAAAAFLVALALVCASYFVTTSVLGHPLIDIGRSEIVDFHAPDHSAALVWSMLLTGAFQWCAQIWVSRRLARVVGSGNMAAGLGGAKMARPLLIGSMAIGLCLVAVATASFNESRPTFFLSLLDEIRGAADVGLGWHWRCAEIVLLTQIMILAPVAEEMFFRGWIWTELRRAWPVPLVMLATAIPFVLVHGAEGALNGVALLPQTVVLSLARHFGGGIRASMLCHVLFNVVGCALFLAA